MFSNIKLIHLKNFKKITNSYDIKQCSNYSISCDSSNILKKIFIWHKITSIQCNRWQKI